MTYFSSHLIWPAQPVATPLLTWYSQSSVWPVRLDLVSCGKSLGCLSQSPRLITSLYSFCNVLIVWSLFLADCGENWEVSLLFPLNGPKAPRSRAGNLPPPHPLLARMYTHPCVMNTYTSVCVYIHTRRREGVWHPASLGFLCPWGF